MTFKWTFEGHLKVIVKIIPKGNFKKMLKGILKGKFERQFGMVIWLGV